MYRALTNQIKEIDNQVQLIHRMMEQEIEMFLTDEQQELVNSIMESDITERRKRIEQMLKNYSYDWVVTAGCNAISLGEINAKKVN